MIAGVDPISLGILAPPGELGIGLAVGTTQTLGVHMNGGGGAGGFIASRDEERYAARVPDVAGEHLRDDRTWRTRFRHFALRADLVRST